MAEALPLKVWVLILDQQAHVRPVEECFGGRAQFIYDTEWEPERLLQAHPDIILCVNDYPYGVARCLDAARGAGIPSLVLQDGILEWRCQFENPLFGAGGGPPQHQPVHADKIACIGAQSARQISAWGNAAKVEVTGMPRLDYLATRPFAAPRKPGTRLLVMTAKNPGFTPGQRQVTLSSLQELKAYLDTRPDLQVTWRVSRSLEAPLGVDNKLSQMVSQELVSQIEQADAVITTISTAMLEAMCLNRPVAALDFHNVPRFIPTAWTISSSQHIPGVVSELLDPPVAKMVFQKETLEDALWRTSPAAVRVGALMEKMVAIARDASPEAKYNLPPDLLGSEIAYERENTHPHPLAELYPGHPVFQESDLLTIQLQLARLQKENERLVEKLRIRSVGYWVDVAARGLMRRLSRRP